MMKRNLAKGRGFKEVCTEFLEWCGKDYIFCTWGPMDLTELQTNMAFYYMDKLPRPLKFFKSSADICKHGRPNRFYRQ